MPERPHQEVTQDALDRVEATAQRELDSLGDALRRELADFRELARERHTEILRRLGEANNAHDKAVIEKQRTDEAATRIQERAVTKADLQVWKDEVERRFATMAGAATVRATLLSVAIGVAVTLLNFVLRYLDS